MRKFVEEEIAVAGVVLRVVQFLQIGVNDLNEQLDRFLFLDHIGGSQAMGRKLAEFPFSKVKSGKKERNRNSDDGQLI